MFSIASAGFVLAHVPPSPVSIDSTNYTSVIPSTFIIDLGMVSISNTASTEPVFPETSSTIFIPNIFEIVNGIPPLTPVSNPIHSLTIPSVWDNVSPVLEWDDAFEGPLLSIELSPLVHLSPGELEGSTLPFTLAQVNDWAYYTPTEVFISLSSPHTHTNSLHIERLPIIWFSLRRCNFLNFLPSLKVYRSSLFLLTMAKGLPVLLQIITPIFPLQTAS